MKNQVEDIYRIDIYREIYSIRTTIGRIFLNGMFFGYTLEDTARPSNVKVYGETSVDAGIYRAALENSPRYGRTLTLKNVPGFRFIRFHGGNDHDDTSGCILVARLLIGEDKIQGTLKVELAEAVEGFKNIFVHIHDVSNWELSK